MQLLSADWKSERKKRRGSGRPVDADGIPPRRGPAKGRRCGDCGLGCRPDRCPRSDLLAGLPVVGTREDHSRTPAAVSGPFIEVRGEVFTVGDGHDALVERFVKITFFVGLLALIDVDVPRVRMSDQLFWIVMNVCRAWPPCSSASMHRSRPGRLFR